MTDIAVPRPAALSTGPDTAAVCPYLLATDGAWRSSGPSRDHRCHAVAPPALLASDKQRRLCLVAEHTGCSTYMAAMADLAGPRSPLARPVHRPVTQTAPLVMDRGRFPMAVPGIPDRGVGQGGLVALMVVAFGALAVTRLGGGGPDIGPAAGVDASPSAITASPVVPSPAPSTPTATPTRTLVPSGVEPTPVTTPAPVSTPRATPPPTPAATTYTVQTGDTLSGIASEHGTTWQVLAKLNKIENPRHLRVGQVLKLPA